jgi:hypothetical protein
MHVSTDCVIHQQPRGAIDDDAPAVAGERSEVLAIESNHTIEIDSFVPREQIDERPTVSAADFPICCR